MAKQQLNFNWICSKLNELKIIHNDGKVAFRSWDSRGIVTFDDLRLIVETNFHFNTNVPEAERSGIVFEAFKENARHANPDERTLRASILKQEQTFLNRPVVDYVLATSLSATRPSSLYRKSLDGAFFYFSDALPRSFARDKIELPSNWTRHLEFPSGHMATRVRVKARSDHEAFKKSIDSLDFLRGIWNYSINRRINDEFTIGGVSPSINKIRLGSAHTLHFPDGRLASPAVWYEIADDRLASLDPKIIDWVLTSEEESIFRKHYKKLDEKYQAFLKEGLIRYARSLDSLDEESAFLKMWSLLEHLTVIGETENYSEVIKRCLFLCSDIDYNQMILEHLRIRRNQSIHSGEWSVRNKKYSFQVKKYVDWLISLHLGSWKSGRTPEQTGLLLACPRDPNIIRDQIQSQEEKISLFKMALDIRK